MDLGRLPRPSRHDVLVAAGAASWSAAWLADRPLLGVPMGAWLLAAVLAATARPVLGASAVWTACLAVAVAGVPSENPATLLAVLVSCYAVGRHASGRTAAALVAAFTLLLAGHDGFNPASLVFVGVVLGATARFGVVVRNRAAAARLARTQAEQMAAVDPSRVAADVVAAERARIASSTVTVIEGAVREMLHDARRGVTAPDAQALARIQAHGAAAVGELRRLLGLLRGGDEEMPADQPPGAPLAADAPRGRARLHAALRPAALACLLALGLLEVTAASGGTPVAGWLVMTALWGSVATRRIRPTSACGVFAVALAVGAVAQVPHAYTVATAAVGGLLAWRAAVRGGRDQLGLVWLTLAAGAYTALTEPDNLPMTLALLAVPAFAGRAWGEAAREEGTADVTSSRLREAVDEVVDAAVRDDRLRLARELHDITSHAVGVMVLHAGAAQTHLAQDPERARSSLDVLVDVGEDALHQLARLGDVLRAGHHERTGDTTLAASLTSLAERITSAGVETTLRIEAEPADDAVSSAVLRLVQESLTNVVRHAPGSRVSVTVRDAGDALEVCVVDAGSKRRPVHALAGADRDEAGLGGGFGLVGLRERVRDVGGDLEAGPRAAGGFRVLGRFPGPVRPAESSS